MTLMQGLRYIHGLQDEKFIGKGMTVSKKSVAAAKDFWIKFHTHDMVITTGFDDTILFENCINGKTCFSFYVKKYEDDYDVFVAKIHGTAYADLF